MKPLNYIAALTWITIFLGIAFLGWVIRRKNDY